MKAMLKIEFHRAFHSPFMAISLAMGGAIALLQALTHVLPLWRYIAMGAYPITVYQKWMGGENMSLWPHLYYLTAPLLGAMPYLGTAYQDHKSGYIKNALTRTKKINYIGSKYIVTFVVSGLVAVFPLILNFALSALMLPATLPQASTGLYPIGPLSLMGALFYTNPLVYVLLYAMLNFVFFGLLTTTGLLIVRIANHVFSVMLAPFMLYLIVFGVTQLSGAYRFCPYGFLRPSQPVATNWLFIMLEIVIMLMVGGVYVYTEKKSEIY